MNTNDYTKQLEDEIAALKKKLEEKDVVEYPHNKILNLRSLNEITEESPIVINNAKNKPECKLISAYRNKMNGCLIIKFKKKTGFFGGWRYKEMQGWHDQWFAFPISKGSVHSDKSNNLIDEYDIDTAQAFLRILESIGILDRNNKTLGM